MWIFWTTNNKLSRVPDGKRKTLKCGSCKKTATFYECNADEGLSLYSVLEVWKNTKRVVQCGECLAVYDYDDVFPEEKAAKEQEEAARKAKEAAERQKQDDLRRQQQEAWQKREEERNKEREELRRQKEEYDRRQRELKQKAQGAAVDAELEALKKRMNKK